MVLETSTFDLNPIKLIRFIGQTCCFRGGVIASVFISEKRLIEDEANADAIRRIFDNSQIKMGSGCSNVMFIIYGKTDRLLDVRSGNPIFYRFVSYIDKYEESANEQLANQVNERDVLVELLRKLREKLSGENST